MNFATGGWRSCDVYNLDAKPKTNLKQQMLKSQSEKYKVIVRKSKDPKIYFGLKLIERKNTRLKHQSEQFVREITYKGGRGAKAPHPPF